jgi:hypothetical protein
MNNLLIHELDIKNDLAYKKISYDFSCAALSIKEYFDDLAKELGFYIAGMN